MIIWVSFSVFIALPWISDISQVFTKTIAVLIVGGIAIIPGAAMAFVYATMAYFKHKKPKENYGELVSVLVAAYNEEDSIIDTLNSLTKQNYLGDIEIIVCNDGSTDRTGELVDNYIDNFEGDRKKFRLKHIQLEKNSGKSEALNAGLKIADAAATITVDADTTLHDNAIQFLVNKLMFGDKKPSAVAGVVLVKNTFKNFMTRIQHWDYMVGMSAVKRAQSAYGATLVAQGAFSAYKTEILKKIGGWDNTVGEDIVLSWKMLDEDFIIDYEPNAIVFTNVPTTYKTFFHQRKRWSRGLIEAFRNTPKLLLKRKEYVPFIYYNALFPFLDICFVFVFLPSVIAAVFFQWYLLASLVTLLILPLGVFLNFLIFFKQKDTLKKNRLSINQNFLGFIYFIFLYQIIQVPATLAGYFSEIFKLKKSWGTK